MSKAFKQMAAHDMAFSECHQLVDELREHPGVFQLNGQGANPAGLGAMFIINPLLGGSAEVQQVLETMLKDDIPDNSVISIYQIAMPSVDWLIRGSEMLRGGRMKGEDAKVADQLSRDQFDRMEKQRYSTLCELPKLEVEKGRRNPMVRARDVNVVISIRSPLKAFCPTEKELKGFLRGMEQIRTSLCNLPNVNPQQVQSKRLLLMLQSILVRGDGSAWQKDDLQINPDQPLNEQILEPGCMVEHSNEHLIELKSGNPADTHYATVLTPARWPGEMTFGAMMHLIGDIHHGRDDTMQRVDYIAATHILVPNRNKALTRFNNRKGRMSLTAKGKVLEWIDNLKFQHRDYSELAREMEQEGTRLVQVAHQLTLFSPDKEELKEITLRCREKFKAKTGFEYRQETFFLTPMFLNALPLNVEFPVFLHAKRSMEMSSRAATFLLPLFGEWKGNALNGPLQLVTRCGQLMNLDIFQTNGGYNGVCCASTGKGKSFFFNFLIDTYLGSGMRNYSLSEAESRNHEGPDDGARAFIVDAGASYKNMADQYQDAQFMEFSGAMEYSLDPFQKVTNWRDEVINGVEMPGQSIMVVNMIEAMMVREGGLGDHRYAALTKYCTQVWDEKGPQGSLDDVRDLLKQDSDQDIHRMAVMLDNWCTGGVYEGYFTKKKPAVDFSRRLVILELGSLKTNPHMQRVVLMALVNAAQHVMFQHPDRRSLFVVDEAWEFLKDSAGGSASGLASFLETAFRRFRKTLASGWVITQSLFDLYDSAVGMALISNSDWKFVLGQKSEPITKLQNESNYGAPAGVYPLMRSIHTELGAYSELLVEHNELRQVGRLVIGRARQIVYSTNPDDKMLVQNYLDRGLSRVEACKAVAHDELGPRPDRRRRAA